MEYLFSTNLYLRNWTNAKTEFNKNSGLRNGKLMRETLARDLPFFKERCIHPEVVSFKCCCSLLFDCLPLCLFGCLAVPKCWFSAAVLKPVNSRAARCLATLTQASSADLFLFFASGSCCYSHTHPCYLSLPLSFSLSLSLFCISHESFLCLICSSTDHTSLKK